MSLETKKLEIKKRVKDLEIEVEKQFKITEYQIKTYGNELAGDIWNPYIKLVYKLKILKNSLYYKLV